MFGFEAKLPVDQKTREWIDGGFLVLESALGRERMRKAQVILPIDKYFPEKYDKEGDGLEILFRRVCGYMEVDRSQVELALIPDNVAGLSKHLPYWHEKRSEAAGVYWGQGEEAVPVVAVRETFAREPMVAVAVMAHELAHVILLGGNLIDREREDMEQLTDLATVFLGFGIFTANVAFRYEKFEDFRMSGWSVNKTGYISEEMYGYALARFAFERREARPDWAWQLCTNVKGYFKRSEKWLAANARRNG